MSKMFKKLDKKNIKEVKAELARAHMIVTLLSIAVIILLTLGTSQPVTFDITLSAVCVALLSIVAVISLCVSVSLYKKQ